MNAEETRRSYSELRETLARLGLTWVVHQVEETIHAGQRVEKETRIFKDEEPPEQQGTLWDEAFASRRPGKPALMMTLEPWPYADQFLFLIDGVRHAIFHAAHVENEGLRLLRTLGNVETVQFESDAEDTDHHLLKLTGQTDERIGELGKLLDALEREVKE